MAELTVLVTGAGALLGQGILRSLRAANLEVRIVTADPDARAAGHWLGDCAVLIPLARDPAYLSRIEEIIVAEHVDVVLVGTDIELAIFAASRHDLEQRHGVRIVVSSPEVVDIADDKLLTARFLEQRGLPFARSAPTSDASAARALVSQIGLPLFAKPARGARSVGARVVSTVDDLELALATPGLVLQELLPDEVGEFTAGCLFLDDRCSGVVVLRRDLRDGNTFRAYHDATCDRWVPFVEQVASALRPCGPCNFQFRVRGGEAVVFEINSRFSGTTPLRAMFGFNEVEHLLRYLLHGTPVPPVRVRDGAVLRTTSDLFVEGSTLEALRASGRLESPRAEQLPFVNDRSRP